MYVVQLTGIFNSLLYIIFYSTSSLRQGSPIDDLKRSASTQSMIIKRYHLVGARHRHTLAGMTCDSATMN